jgi:acetyl-CoA C-acetyltransferase
MTDILVLSAARTAIGSFGGSLSSLPPTSLGAIAAKASLDRAGVHPEQVGNTVFGHVINTEPKDMYLSRVAAMEAGVLETAPAMNVNRLCGSGIQAIVSATQSLMSGEANYALAGGAECMSRAPYSLPQLRFGQKMGDAGATDMLTGTLTCPFGTGHMGVTAENIAREQQISREDQDAFALESQNRAARAIAERRFTREIVPVEIRGRKGPIIFDTDEHPKTTSLEQLAGLPPAFSRSGSVTAGNASGINDGAAAILLAREKAVSSAGLTPRARILGFAIAGVRPDVMGYGPIPAVKLLCDRTGLKVSDFDVIESNEAFAAQALAVNRILDLDPEKVNPNGGAIALGHPVGATGAILTVKAIHELDRTGGRLALVTMCIGGGQGIALALGAI